MKESELRDHATCSYCRKKIGHCGFPSFWVVNLKRFSIDMSAVKRATGLAYMLGSVELAQVMGPDEDMAQEVQPEITLTLCEMCSTMLCPLLEVCTDADIIEET